MFNHLHVIVDNTKLQSQGKAGQGTFRNSMLLTINLEKKCSLQKIMSSIRVKTNIGLQMDICLALFKGFKFVIPIEVINL